MATETDDAFFRLGEAFLNPTRARADEVDRLARRSTWDEEAWEVMVTRGVIPEDWIGSPARRFATTPWPQGNWQAGIFERHLARSSTMPPSFAFARAIAADVPGVLRAEEGARAWHARQAALAPLPPFAGVVWRALPPLGKGWRLQSDDLALRLRDAALVQVMRRRVDPSYELTSIDRALESDAMQPIQVRYNGAISRVMDGVRSRCDSQVYRFASVTALRSLIERVGPTVMFDEAQREDAVLEPDWRWPMISRATRFAALLNPTSPCLDVYAAGYACQGLYDAEGGAWVVLVTPLLHASIFPRPA